MDAGEVLDRLVQSPSLDDDRLESRLDRSHDEVRESRHGKDVGERVLKDRVLRLGIEHPHHDDILRGAVAVDGKLQAETGHDADSNDRSGIGEPRQAPGLLPEDPGVGRARPRREDDLGGRSVAMEELGLRCLQFVARPCHGLDEEVVGDGVERRRSALEEPLAHIGPAPARLVRVGGGPDPRVEEIVALLAACQVAIGEPLAAAEARDLPIDDRGRVLVVVHLARPWIRTSARSRSASSCPRTPSRDTGRARSGGSHRGSSRRRARSRSSRARCIPCHRASSAPCTPWR